MESTPFKATIAIVRIAMGIQLLWAFIDKLYGLGFATESGKGWIFGGSPSLGFLKFGAAGPFAQIYNAIGGTVAVDWLFMLGLLFIGLALFLGIGMKIASYAGAVMMFLMWSVVLPKENNIFLIDEHFIYLMILLVLNFARAGQIVGAGRWWTNTKLVKKLPWLE